MNEKNGAAAPAKKSPPISGNGLPLFFKQPVALDAKRHAKAGIFPANNFTFAADTNSVPLNTIEFVEAAKYYPIVFTTGEVILPAALVGLEQQNYYVDSKGEWKEGTYIPGYIRKYPFIFTETAGRKDLLLCVDEGAPHYKTKPGEGILPFFENEKPSDMTKNALEFCSAFHNHHQITRQFCEDLQKHKLLVGNQSDIKLFNGRSIRLSGFQLIDEKKVSELSDEVFLEFRKKGWLPFIYFAMMSSANWRHLVDLAATREPKKKSA